MIENEKTKAVINEVNTNAKKPNRKFYIVHAVQIVVGAALAGSLSVINYYSATTYWIAKIIQLAAFLTIGIVHIHLIKKTLFSIDTKFELRKLLFSTLLWVLILLVLAILYLSFAPDMLVMSLASSCLFLLPAVVFSAWIIYNGFTQTQPLPWYNYENIKDNRVTIYLNSIPVYFKLTKKYSDAEEEIFSATLPGHVVFGKLFNQFLVNNNNDNSIEVSDEKKELYGWIFFTENLRGMKDFYIDPEKTLRENNVKENLIIIAKRVKKEMENNETQ